eukprot:Sspe_Gene.14994::Locus_5196_Transcript_2_2_Confidence_0.667_Length_4954::g.14994::m.14994
MMSVMWIGTVEKESRPSSPMPRARVAENNAVVRLTRGCFSWSFTPPFFIFRCFAVSCPSPSSPPALPSRCRMASTSFMNPRIRTRSASSTMSHSTCPFHTHPFVFRMWSSRRPGVATTIVTPSRSVLASAATFVPPVMRPAVILVGRCATSRSTTLRIWWPSSFVGAMTMHFVPLISPPRSNASSMGTTKASVFPLPVFACPKTSLPARSSGMLRRWISVMVVKPSLRSAPDSSGSRPSSANLTGRDAGGWYDCRASPSATEQSGLFSCCGTRPSHHRFRSHHFFFFAFDSVGTSPRRTRASTSSSSRASRTEAFIFPWSGGANGGMSNGGASSWSGPSPSSLTSPSLTISSSALCSSFSKSRLSFLLFPLIPIRVVTPGSVQHVGRIQLREQEGVGILPKVTVFVENCRGQRDKAREGREETRQASGWSTKCPLCHPTAALHHSNRWSSSVGRLGSCSTASCQSQSLQAGLPTRVANKGFEGHLPCSIRSE